MRCEDETRSRPFQPPLASFGVSDATDTAPKAYARSPEHEIALMALPRDRLRNPEAKSASSGEDYMGTSRLHARYDFSPNDSLTTLTRISSKFPQLERQMTRNMRILVPDSEGVLEPTTLPPFRRPDHEPVLECPFTFMKCFRQFAIADERAWIKHSLDHFRIDGRRPRIVDPPKVNSCCFCSRTFQALSGIDSWQERMDHVKAHHQHLGHRLAATRYDFALVEYFWQNGLLSTADYREIKGRAGAATRSAGEIPSPPDLPRWAGAASRRAEEKPCPPDLPRLTEAALRNPHDNPSSPDLPGALGDSQAKFIKGENNSDV